MMTEKELIDKLFIIKEAADRGIELIANQGQPLDGNAELANYRSLLETYQKEQLKEFFNEVV